MKKEINIDIYPDKSGGKIYFDLVGIRQYLRTMVDLTTLEIDVIDRHIRAFFSRGESCDRFKRCYLSIADYTTFHRKKLTDIDINEIWEAMKRVW